MKIHHTTLAQRIEWRLFKKCRDGTTHPIVVSKALIKVIAPQLAEYVPIDLLPGRYRSRRLHPLHKGLALMPDQTNKPYFISFQYKPQSCAHPSLANAVMMASMMPQTLDDIRYMERALIELLRDQTNPLALSTPLPLPEGEDQAQEPEEVIVVITNIIPLPVPPPL
jgi:hypothetical protein